MKRFVKLMALGISAVFVFSAVAADVAKVNSKVITDADVKKSLATLNEGQRRQILSDMNSRREVVHNLVDQELLIQEAEKQKLDKDAEYQNALNAFRRQFLADRLVAKSVRPKLTESAAKRYYQMHRRDYSTDQVHIQHILVSDEKTAREVLKLAKAPGADFQKLAETRSQDPSAKNNRGDIGLVTRDAPFVAEFKEAAFNGKKGQIIGPVKTAFGYHLIKIIDSRPGKVYGYEEVELKVKSDLQKEMVANYITRLKKGATVSFNESAINAIQ